jgi:hypothetical protein
LRPIPHDLQNVDGILLSVKWGTGACGQYRGPIFFAGHREHHLAHATRDSISGRWLPVAKPLSRMHVPLEAVNVPDRFLINSMLRCLLKESQASGSCPLPRPLSDQAFIGALPAMEKVRMPPILRSGLQTTGGNVG